MRKFSESIDNYFSGASENIFKDVSLLKDILIEFEDIGMKYDVLYNLQKYHHDDMMSVKGPSKTNNCWDLETGEIRSTGSTGITISNSSDYVKCYIIQFEEYAFDTFVSDAQRTGSHYGTPDKKFYDFIGIMKDVQYRIESMGHTLTLCGNLTDTSSDGGIKIMILEGKHK